MKPQKSANTAGMPQIHANAGPAAMPLPRIKTGRPHWKKSLRFERIGYFALNGSAAQIFPLLCPVLEYEWLPGWSCTMLYSASGVAEKDAVFHTRENLGRHVVWTTITYEPDTFVEYLMISGKDAVIRLSVSLKDKGNKTTDITWRMLFTATSALGTLILKKAFTEKNFQKMMADREKELNHYLEKGEMINNKKS